MKHKIGDVVLVPMRIGGGWVNSKGTGHFVEVWGEASSTFGVSDAFLDTCAAAPRVPKVGDRVRLRGLPDGHPMTIVAIEGTETILKWRRSDGLLLAATYQLADLLFVDEAAP